MAMPVDQPLLQLCSGAQVPPVHFCESTTGSYAKITILTTEDPGINKKTWCGHWHAWGEICDLYFPKIASNPSNPRWFVDREAYRGRPRHPSQIKLDLVVKMLTPA